MYWGSAPQGAQRWHWGNAAPNSGGAGAHTSDPILDAKTTWTFKEQAELYIAARDVLKEHGVTDYFLAMKLADEIASLRDRQRS